ISLENLKAWLGGSANTLAAHSYVELFKFLGVSKEGLLPDRVHLWTVDAGWSGKLNQKNLSILEWAGNLVSECKMVEVINGSENNKSIFQKKRVFMILGEKVKIRVMIHVTSQWNEPPAIDPIVLPGVQWEGDDGKGMVLKADGMYWKSINEGSLTISEFDDVFTGDFQKCSWNNLRLVAREHGVTPAMIANWIITRSRPLLAYEKPKNDDYRLPEAERSEKESLERDVIEIDYIPEVIKSNEQQPQKKTINRKPAAKKTGRKKKVDEIIIEEKVIHPAEQMMTDTH
ncbi:MAG TPA: hypothetical protein VIY47_06315, partial [Ignavibacteriaceae bacterium]